ncbi:cobalamin-dependent protein [Candidatus Uabimicrobium amorphum]|uniref:Cobalamin-binding protein n=1 Tax=Uabimicrobium amorphum TaxID=2596890 RepID=A0A5S9ITD6_UABAM|nr:cobalamin-dependent protein [Candidatus Uabimicrobium amorphum]BBM87201.1 cobalamin-binding protein [Candidatus Uabimicrobium amorphum]
MNHETQGLQKRYLETLVQGNADACSKVISDALEKGLSLAHIYCDVIAPSQAKMGALWLDGEINIAQEHLATMITLQEMARLRSVFEPKKLHGLQAVVAVAEKDLHVIGAQMVADLLYINGWKVDFLGANVPSRDLVDFVRKKEPHVVALSVSLPESVPLVKKAIIQMRKFDDSPRIIVGGLAIDPNFVEDLDVEVIQSAQQIVETLNQNVQPISLGDYLKKIGKQIQFLRKKNKQSQQELANACGLDRTYISAVEHGKQNITIGALHKISGALDIPINEFLNKVHNTL